MEERKIMDSLSHETLELMKPSMEEQKIMESRSHENLYDSFSDPNPNLEQNRVVQSGAASPPITNKLVRKRSLKKWRLKKVTLKFFKGKFFAIEIETLIASWLLSIMMLKI